VKGSSPEQFVFVTGQSGVFPHHSSNPYSEPEIRNELERRGYLAEEIEEVLNTHARINLIAARCLFLPSSVDVPLGTVG